jgi:sortase (surface protein transpeptidase)
MDERLPAPRTVRIPGIGVATRIVPVGLHRDGVLAIPEDVSLVGWYELGVPPGADRGSAVLVAHRDGRGQGRGVFYDLGRLDVGDELTVRTSSGASLGFRVVARESIRKQSLPYEELFAADGAPRLTLISCGGAYVPDRGGYQDNVVVTAVPVPPSPESRT